MTSPGISLVIPAFNASRYLREAIDSALLQTIKPRQVIVVDDGSADNTLEIARGYGDAVTVIANAHGGISLARNRGIKEANQPLIAFLDADDRFIPDKLERQLQSLSERPEALLSMCRVRDFWSPDLPPDFRRETNLTPQYRPGQAGTWLARRELFDLAGTFNVEPECRFIEGSELFTRIENTGCAVVKIDDLLLERRLHASNHTANSKAHLDGIMTLMKRRMDLRRSSA
jgi:glycosyltransferase involved in cell wall biosynthesis